MDNNSNGDISFESPSWGKSDHLTYLEKRSSIFESKDVAKIAKKELICAECGNCITKVSEKIDIQGRHDHSFGNLGYLVRLGCYRKAAGCAGIRGISHGYSWFRGYSWQIQVCSTCFTQLGWKYMSRNDSFYGLVFNTLRERDPV